MGFVLVIHMLAAVFLVIAVLMQAGRGGGLAESFSSAENMFGTQANAFLVRITTILAAVFFITSLFLAYNGARTNKSLMADKKLLPKAEQAAKDSSAARAAEDPGVSIKIDEPRPMDAADKVDEAVKAVKVPVNIDETTVKPVVNATNP